MNSTSETLYQQAEGLDVHEAEDGLIIFNPGTDRVHHLNSTAGVVFSLCDQPRSGLVLIESFAELFDLEQSSAETVQTVLAQLSEEGVLVETNDS